MNLAPGDACDPFTHEVLLRSHCGETLLVIMRDSRGSMVCIPALNHVAPITNDTLHELRASVAAKHHLQDPATIGVSEGVADVLSRIAKALALKGSERDRLEDGDIYQPSDLERVYVDVIDRCNFRCPYCYADSGPTIELPEPSLEQLAALADDLAVINPNMLVIITGGEPTLRPDLPQVIQIFTRKLHAQLFSNGLLMDRVPIDELRALDAINISVHPDELDEHRSKRVWANCQSLREAGLSVSIQITVTRSNLDKALHHITTGLQLGFSVKPNLFDPVGRGAVTRTDVFQKQELITLSNQLRELEQSLGVKNRLQDFYVYNLRPGFLSDMCGVGRTVVHLKTDGSVYPCSNLMESAFCLGRVEPQRPLSALLADPTVVQRVQALRVPVYQQDSCKECGLRYSCRDGCRAIHMMQQEVEPDARHPRCQLHQHEVIRKFRARYPDVTPHQSTPVPAPAKPGVPEDPHLQMQAELLQAALELVQPMVRGQPVEVAHLLPRQQPIPVTLEENGTVYEMPEYVAAAATLAQVMEHHVLLDASGAELDIQAVVPRNPLDFMVRSRRVAGFYVGMLSSVCDAKCEFCYERDNPLPWGRFLVPTANVMRRLQEDGDGYSVATPMRFLLEPTIHPDFLEVVKAVREKLPGQEIAFQTNGVSLTPKILDGLGKALPLHLEISLNAPDQDRRARVMQFRKDDHCLEALRSLRNRGIRFAASVVAWPELSLEEMEQAIALADQCGAGHVSLHFGSFHRHQPLPAGYGEEWRVFWSKLREWVPGVRRRYRTPIMCTPGAFMQPHIAPVLEGVVRNSPADHAGLMVGDLIVRLDGYPMHTKSDVLDHVSFMWPKRPVRVEVLRQGRPMEFTIRNTLGVDDDLPPYKPRGYLPIPDAGLCLSQDITSSDLVSLVQILEERKPRKPVLMSSALMAPLARQAVDKFPSVAYRLQDFDLRIIPVRNTFFGGNIQLGDLLTVGDHIRAIQDLVQQGSAPDLVIIPSSFLCRFDKDLGGTSYRWIERCTGIKVALLPCQRIAL